MPSLSKIHENEPGSRGRGRPRDEVAKSRILEAALYVLEESGYANTTIDAIAERAGASKATIYRWWPSKAAVMLEAMREAVAQELPFPDTGDLRQDVTLQLRNFLTLLTGPRRCAIKAFVAAAQTDPEVSETFGSVWVSPRRQYAKKCLEKYRGVSLRDDVDLDLVLDMLYGPLYYRLLIKHAPLSEAFTDALADFVLAGVSKTETKLSISPPTRYI
jgi:AcrR family transcriptional regulator